MQSRPKIPRTPLDGGKPQPVYNNQEQRQDIPQAQEEIVPKIKGQVVKDDKQIEEFKSAFVTKDEKIPRTPPEEDRNRYMEKRAAEHHQNMFSNQVTSSLPMLQPNQLAPIQPLNDPGMQYQGSHRFQGPGQNNNFYQQPIAPSQYAMAAQMRPRNLAQPPPQMPYQNQQPYRGPAYNPANAAP